MTKPLIYLITRGTAKDASFAGDSAEILSTVKHAVNEAVSLIQIREKQLSAKLLFELATAAAKLTTGSATKLLVNDRADIALAAGADGVHLTSISLPAKIIKENFPPGFVIGVSTHTIEETVAVAKSGADFAVFGPIFSTPEKTETTGLAVLADVCKHVEPFPVIAIGGIDGSNCESIIAAGANGIAAIRSLNDPRGLRSIARKLDK